MADQVQAKFGVQTVERQGGKKLNPETQQYDKPFTASVKVNLAPVYAPKDAQCENAKFWDATPSGQLWMQINNPAAFDFFEEGADYYLTFQKA